MKYLIAIIVFGSLSACGGDKSTSTTEDDTPKGVIPEHQLQALEKAKNVEDVLRESEQQRREELDKQ
jgi:hypothetical protein